MTVLLYLLIITVSFIFCVYFFNRSAGTLHIGRFNLISVIFYLFIVQTFIGAALVIMGLNQHYTLQKLASPDSSIIMMFCVVMAASVIWPACMLLFLKLFRVNPKQDYNAYLKKPLSGINERYIFWSVLGIGGVCLVLLAVYLFKIGYIPLLKLFSSSESFSFASERVKISNTYLINVYVRNILILLAIPVISYITFAFALATRSKKWIIAAIVFFAASLITETYNFEKTPLIFHMMIYALVFICFKGGIKAKWMVYILGAGAALLFLSYFAIGSDIQLSLYEGMGGRLLFSQVGALTYNFDLFPNTFPFLLGRSMSPTILRLLHIDPALYLRSARLIMEYYSPYGVYEGVAGVMNSFFIGEAYANFGWAGAAFSVIWTAFVVSGLYAMLLKIRKTPVTIALAAYLAISVATTTNGGFMDFIYNVSWMIVIGGLLLFEYLPDIGRAVKKLLGRNQ